MCSAAGLNERKWISLTKMTLNLARQEGAFSILALNEVFFYCSLASSTLYLLFGILPKESHCCRKFALFFQPPFFPLWGILSQVKSVTLILMQAGQLRISGLPRSTCRHYSLHIDIQA